MQDSVMPNLPMHAHIQTPPCHPSPLKTFVMFPAVPMLLLPPAGTPPLSKEPWTQDVEWARGNALEPRTYERLLPGALAAISCVGGFGTQSEMQRINGAANAAAIAASKAAGIPRFVYVSAHTPNVPGIDLLLSGYIQVHIETAPRCWQSPDKMCVMLLMFSRKLWRGRSAQDTTLMCGYHAPSLRLCHVAVALCLRCLQGKQAAEQELFRSYPDTGVALRPWIIYGDRAVR